MIKAKRLAHATFSTPDIQRQVEYWTGVMGLTVVDQTPGRAILATKLGQEAVALELGERADLTKIAFQVAPDLEINELEGRLTKAGIRAEQRTSPTPAIAKSLAFHDPRGTLVEVFAETRFHPRSASDEGVSPLKIGHVASRVKDVEKMADFYQNVLGFRVSDWLGDHFVFMRCGADHHTVNFVQFETERLHHMAFEVKDWAEIHRACEIQTKNKIQLVWGPLRHVVGHNVAAYHRNTDDLRVESYCEMDQMTDEELGYWAPRPWHEELPLRPTKWPKDTWRSAWGFGSFGTFPGYP